MSKKARIAELESEVENLKLTLEALENRLYNLEVFTNLHELKELRTTNENFLQKILNLEDSCRNLRDKFTILDLKDIDHEQANK